MLLQKISAEADTRPGAARVVFVLALVFVFVFVIVMAFFAFLRKRPVISKSVRFIPVLRGNNVA